MFIIGENIHIISPQVRQAIEGRDAAFIQNLARRQVESGAQALDLNIGPQRRQGPEVMKWLVEAIQEVADVPLSLDTTNRAAMEAGLKAARRQCILNSASAEEERLREVPALAARYGAKLIVLAMGKNIPATAEERVTLALETLIPRAMEVGIPMEDLYLDPLVLTVNGMQEQAMQAVEAVRFLKITADPPPQTVVGLSNVSNGVPREGRSLINRTFLVMLMGAGLDAAIADPFDRELRQYVRIVEEQDDSTPVGRLLLALHDSVATMGELTPDQVDMGDPEQVVIWKTVQILTNEVIYAESYLRV